VTCDLRPVTRVLLLLAFISAPAFSDCLPFSQAKDHIGETLCVKGRVLKVSVGASGIHFLNFCEDYRTCPFTIVVFPRDLRDVGDVRSLQNQDVEVYGLVKSYQGQAEIILRDSSQLRGELASLPKLPKNYDADKKGKYSSGTFKGNSSSTAPKKSKGHREPTFPDE
jgi:DNA/RNA endonuclease YhcR with UshA esterase domain